MTIKAGTKPNNNVHITTVTDVLVSDNVGDAVRGYFSATPRKYVALQVLSVLGAILFALTIIYSVHDHRHAVQVVCYDTAPSIVAAQHIKAALADLDANAANELLAGPQHRDSAAKDYASRSSELTDNLVKASQNITYGDNERKPILTIADGLLSYESMVAQALTQQDHSDAAFEQTYQKATRQLHDVMLPAADALDKANRDHLDATYRAETSYSWATVIGVCVVGGVLILFLLQTQRFVARRSRRLINHGLLVATLVTGGLLAWGVFTLMASGHELYVAKEQAFDSVSALWKARATAYDANGAESRWLLAREHGDTAAADAAQQQYNDLVNKIQKAPTGVGSDAVITGLSKDSSGQYGGYMADELRNITFSGELEAASQTVQEFLHYQDVDARIRKLENDGKHADAVELCTGTRPGESNAVFADFDNALKLTLDINDTEFTRASAEATHRLRIFDVEAAVVALLIAVAAYLGLRARLNEYKI